MLEPLGVKPATAIAAAIGAMISLQFLDDLGPRRRVVSVGSGFFCSVYFTPLLMLWLGKKQGWEWILTTPQVESGTAFLVGLAGLAAVGTLLKFIRVDLIDLIKGWINGRSNNS